MTKKVHLQNLLLFTKSFPWEKLHQNQIFRSSSNFISKNGVFCGDESTKPRFLMGCSSAPILERENLLRLEKWEGEIKMHQKNWVKHCQTQFFYGGEKFQQNMNFKEKEGHQATTLPRGLRLRGPARALDLVSRSKFARPGEVYQLDHVLASSLSWFVKWRFLWTSWFVTLWLLLWLLPRRQRCSMSRIGCLNNLGYLWATLRCHGKK